MSTAAWSPFRLSVAAGAVITVVSVVIYASFGSSPDKLYGRSFLISSDDFKHQSFRQALHDATTRAHLTSSLATRPLAAPKFVRQGGVDFSVSYSDMTAKTASVNINKPVSVDDPLAIGSRDDRLFVAGITVSLLSKSQSKSKDVEVEAIVLSASAAAPSSPSTPSASSKKSFSILLNKFNTLADHALIVTDEFEAQTVPLDRHDVTAWYYLVQQATASVGLFNSDYTAGASQKHKHMQIIPLDSFWAQRPIDSVYPLPLDHLILPRVISGKASPPSCRDLPVVEAAVTAAYARLQAGKGRAGYVGYPVHKLGLTFEHSVAIIQSITDEHSEEREEDRQCLYQKAFLAYCAVLIDLGVSAPACRGGEGAKDQAHSPSDVGGSYNVVITKHYVMAVPRSQRDTYLDVTSAGGAKVSSAASAEAAASSEQVRVGVNGFGFLGFLLASSAENAAAIASAGPMAILDSVGVVA